MVLLWGRGPFRAMIIETQCRARFVRGAAALTVASHPAARYFPPPVPRPARWAARGPCGGVAEWLKAHAWKACIGATLSGVRIPLPPPNFFPENSRLPCRIHFSLANPNLNWRKTNQSWRKIKQSHIDFNKLARKLSASLVAPYRPKNRRFRLRVWPLS